MVTNPQQPEIKPIGNIPPEYETTPKQYTEKPNNPGFLEVPLQEFSKHQEQTSKTIEQRPEIELKKEKKGEIEIEEDQTLESRIHTLKLKLRKKKKKQTQIPIVRDELTIRIEKVMEDGLGDAFTALTPIQKQEFKIKGEETAWEIRQLLKKTHVKIKEIFRLIYEWLKILPGVNKFFLVQEAKIKTDKIVSLKEYNQDK